MNSTIRINVVVVFVLGCCLGNAAASDWPQFRFDAGRSAASPTPLPAELHLLWVRNLPPPRPAFPSEVRLRFDGSYEPVVVGKTIFVPSMVNDSVTAYHTDTGEMLWRYITDGPVRFAPVVANGKVYATSDDGFLYCLNTADGKLLWKFRGLPAGKQDRKLLGNRRLISLWPARGGPVLADGIVYFAAGLWPSDGVFLHAVDAESGRAIWTNDKSNRIPRANMDHGIAQYAGLTPQGYLAVVGEKLVVPCGAQLPAFINKKTGELGPYTMGWGGRVGLPKGSWLVAGTGRYLSHSGDLYDITRPNDEKGPAFKHMLYPGGFTRLAIDATNQRELGSFDEPVITPDAWYVRDPEQGIVAYELANYELVDRKKTKPTPFRANDQYPDKWKAEFAKQWNFPTELQLHIKAGQRLYLGGAGVVQAVDFSKTGGLPTTAWQVKNRGNSSSHAGSRRQIVCRHARRSNTRVRCVQKYRCCHAHQENDQITGSGPMDEAGGKNLARDRSNGWLRRRVRNWKWAINRRIGAPFQVGCNRR